MTTISIQPAVRRAENVRAPAQSDDARDMDVSELVAVIGHELSTPLTTISAAMELIETAQGQRPNALTATVRRQVSRLLTLFDASLRAAELLGGAHTDGAAVTDLTDALTSVRDEWPATEQRLHITLHVPACLPLVAIEERALRIILNNLLINACKHSGGLQMTIAAEVGDGVVRVTLSDDGRGIPAYLRKRVFELGRRGESGSGSGLGLYVTRELARLFGGEVELADTTAGAAFAVTLPVATAEGS
jgi:signal transduction histidine kinase